MKFNMDRETGEVTFAGLQPNSNVIIHLPDKKKLEGKADKDGIVKIDFNKARQMFLRKQVLVQVTHKDFDPVNVNLLIRSTKLIPQPVTEQVKKGK